MKTTTGRLIEMKLTYTAKAFEVAWETKVFKIAGMLDGFIDMATPNGTYPLSLEEAKALAAALGESISDVQANCLHDRRDVLLMAEPAVAPDTNELRAKAWRERNELPLGLTDSVGEAKTCSKCGANWTAPVEKCPVCWAQIEELVTWICREVRLTCNGRFAGRLRQKLGVQPT